MTVMWRITDKFSTRQLQLYHLMVANEQLSEHGVRCCLGCEAFTRSIPTSHAGDVETSPNYRILANDSWVHFEKGVLLLYRASSMIYLHLILV